MRRIPRRYGRPSQGFIPHLSFNPYRQSFSSCPKYRQSDLTKTKQCVRRKSSPGATLSWIAVLAVPFAGWYFYRRERELPLNSGEFSKFLVSKKEYVSENSCILTLHSSERVANLNEALIQKFWKEGIWSIEVKQPQLMISRKYTPLPPDIDNEGGENIESNGTLRFYIRREPKGEVSNYLHSLQIGGQIEIRGGFMEYKIPSRINKIVFLAGGTGIAPALQLLYALRTRSEALTQGFPAVHLLWANRLRGEVRGSHSETEATPNSPASEIGRSARYSQYVNQSSSIMTMIESYKAPEPSTIANSSLNQSKNAHPPQKGLPVDIQYFVDQEGSYINQKSIANAMFTDQKDRTISESSPGDNLVLVSGPDGFVDYVAAPKRVGASQSPIIGGGLFSGLNISGWRVQLL